MQNSQQALRGWVSRAASAEQLGGLVPLWASKLINGNWGALHHAGQRVWENVACLMGLVFRRRKAKEM